MGSPTKGPPLASADPGVGPKTEKAGLVFTPVRISSAGRVIPRRWVPALESKSSSGIPSPGGQMMSQPASLARAEAPAKRSLGTSAAPALRYDLTGLVDVGGYPDDRETTSLESEYLAGVSATHSVPSNPSTRHTRHQDLVNVPTPSAQDQVSEATPGSCPLPQALGRERTSDSGLSVLQVPAVPAVGPPAGNCHPSTSSTPLAKDSVQNAAGEDDMTDDLSDNSEDDSEPSHSAVLRSKVVPTQEI
ncbi:hypothetical protein PtA15_8A396 [Puccinia triticina]|uniref:Uncharacterized protein n=1 Tax=Puccinia triticina TaxID=208348 RepID=A0ABY7CXP7_9BASI|nr:uncharacterized protein PtA15_8A396 [Puccinia triticina]WAQ87492.1 hypothetical protein PtA15_8A396 [Puccinia triticina]